MCMSVQCADCDATTFRFATWPQAKATVKAQAERDLSFVHEKF
jgi:hypothetical protein